MLTLRRFFEKDAPQLVEVCNDGDIQKYLRLNKLPYTEEDALSFIRYCQFSEKRGAKGEQCFAIVYNNMVVGCISYRRDRGCHAHCAEVGYYVGKQYQNKNLAERSLKLLSKLIFVDESVTRLYAVPACENVASCKVLEKCGFVREGTMRKYFYKNDVYYDCYLYALVK